jgi:hypothetical protein
MVLQPDYLDIVDYLIAGRLDEEHVKDSLLIYFLGHEDIVHARLVFELDFRYLNIFVF